MLLRRSDGGWKEDKEDKGDKGELFIRSLPNPLSLIPIPDHQSPIPNDVRLSVVELQSQTDPDFDKLYSVSRFLNSG
ncbi:MAG: hypothetical protein C4323_13495 [Mastigocladus sp. ERB_26_2]